MKSKEILQVSVRLLGLAFVYHGLTELPAVISLLFSGNFGGLVISLLRFGWMLLVAYWFLQGAPLIMRIAYPDTVQSSTNEGE